MGDGRLDFRHDGDNKMTLTSAGNVGIGTTKPDAKLQVNGYTRLGGGSRNPEIKVWQRQVTLDGKGRAVVKFNLPKADTIFHISAIALRKGWWEGSGNIVNDLMDFIGLPDGVNKVYINDSWTPTTNVYYVAIEDYIFVKFPDNGNYANRKCKIFVVYGSE